ncbi:MAG: AraC family transcriptional regulator [Lachnospiraceae bacterium]|nr:AraC family transcriptional regulator [Lachnospiraceae bacterium]
MTDALKYLWKFLDENYHIFYYIYNDDMELLEMYPEGSTLFDYIIRTIDLTAPLIEEKKPLRGPMLLGTDLGVNYIGVTEYTKKGTRRHHILGPISSQTLNRNTLTDIFDQFLYRTQASSIKNIVEEYMTIPVLSTTIQYQYAIQFYSAIVGEVCNVNNIIFPKHEVDTNSLFSSIIEGEKDAAKTQWTLEQEDFQAIHDGNMEHLYRSVNTTINKMPIRSVYEKDSLRSGKNMILMYLGKCLYAAISGGLPPEIGYHLQFYYVEQIESCSTLMDLRQCALDLQKDFITRVHSIKYDTKKYSQPVIQCREYIKLHIEEDINLQVISSHFNYSVYYFSRKFKEECGCTVNDYIKEQRVERAKTLLTTTKLSINEICDKLCFSSPSFFISVFKKYTGTTPVNFRLHGGFISKGMP